jgi:heparan-alpha-glucosaminide N-acetyltransferase
MILTNAAWSIKLLGLQTHKERLKHWLLMGFSLLVLGIILHFTNGNCQYVFIFGYEPVVENFTHYIFTMHCSTFTAIPINKQLYSFSYVCFTAGAAGIVLSVFYILVYSGIVYAFYFGYKTSALCPVL